MAFKIKVNQTSVKILEASVLRRLKEITEDPELLNQVGETVVQDIKAQTRRGFSIPQNGKFKDLSRPWIKRRQQIAEATQTQETYKKNRSNLTLSGQLLDSLFSFIRKNTIAVRNTGIRTLYKIKLKNGSIKDTGKVISNAELAKFVSEERPFIGVRKKVEQRLIILARRFTRRALRR